MSQWPSAKARRVLTALLRIGWILKRQSGSHKTLLAGGIPGLRVRLSRRRRDRSAHAGADREKHGSSPRRLVAGEPAKVFYTADPRALENDEAFVEFLTGSHDVLVVEDADHLLGARTNGNADMHRFLAVADGVVRAQGRKVVFTTNLPNVGDVDEALVRPGRCFALVRTRLLDVEESRRLLAHLAGNEPSRIESALALAFPPGTRAASLATLFRALAPAA